MQIPFKQHKGYDPLGDCGKGKCPICARINAIFKVKAKLEKKEFTSDAISPFVGRFGYPDINLGIIAPPEQREDAWVLDAPGYWAAKSFEIPQIVDFRSSLLNSRYNINIKKRIKLVELSQDIAMSSKPVDIDIELHEKPKFFLNLDACIAPTGPNAKLKKALITENPKIHTKVYKVFEDIDLKAYGAVNYLYENNFDENFLSKLLSVGTLGLKANRKLVPTRWSITATHDMIGKHLINQIKDYNTIDYSLFFGGYLGNYYLILCFPEVWSYELFEMYVKSPNYTTDYELYSGRKNYAKATSGGYYTVRMGILEKFRKLKKQGTVLSLRFITDEYTMPLGVWVTLEATRKAMNSKPIFFSSKELMLEYARKLIKSKFNYNIDYLLNTSKLLKNIKYQTSLEKFF